MSTTDGESSKVALVESCQQPGGLQLVNSYLTNRHADPMDLVAMAESIQKANDTVKAVTGSKLTVIADPNPLPTGAGTKGVTYLSLLSPQDWGASIPHTFLGAFKLEYDMSWTPFEKIQTRSEDFAMIDKIMNAQKAVTDSTTPNFRGLVSEK
ncbi:hypothetical protein ScPMuIL_005915 [Solemya velum]